jgi:hypothetical protein
MTPRDGWPGPDPAAQPSDSGAVTGPGPAAAAQDSEGAQSAGGTAQIVLSRERGGWRDRARSYDVVLDGERVAKIKRGGQVELPVAAGRHEIVLRIDWCSSPTMALDLRPGESVQLSCAPGGSPAGALATALANTDAYIRLSRL